MNLLSLISQNKNKISIEILIDLNNVDGINLH